MWSQPRQRQYDPRTCRLCEFRVKISGEKFSSQATLQRPRSHKWLVATILDSANIKHVHHGRKFDWTVLGANTSAGHHKTGQGEQGGLSLSGKGKQEVFPEGLVLKETARDLQERGLWATWAGTSGQELLSCLCVQLVGSRCELRGTRPKAKPRPARKVFSFRRTLLALILKNNGIVAAF